MKRIIPPVILTIILCFSLSAGAQPNNPNNPVPLDSGLTALLAAGVAYGARRYQKSRQTGKTKSSGQE